MVHYPLPHGKRYQERLFPKPSLLDAATRQQLGLKNFADVIRHFTASSLAQDGIAIVDGSLKVELREGGYHIGFQPAPGFEAQAARFADMHVTLLDEHHFGLALLGADACKRTPAWNPMAG